MMKSIFISFCFLLNLVSTAQEWTHDLDHAKEVAQKEQKDILLVFSGSDWCAPCIKLDNQIWQSEAFKTYAKKHLVLVRADFPKRKNNQLPEEQQKKNNALAEQYNTYGYFPLVVLLNQKAEVLNKLGYKNLPPSDYIKAIYEK
ncbi:thioredoxin family protein [Psychroflexus salinarum]|uniref:Thioredoxin family protein n=1 Tax=Psychroflexus salinarum TaxID=546024 RepID=A0ABW3GQS1_9FLAO